MQRGIELDTMVRWLCGSFGRAYLSAVISKHQQWQAHTPLPKNAFYCGWEPGYTRPTEWYASFLWGNGYLPGNIHVDERWQLPKNLNIKVDWRWVGSEPEPHHNAHGQCCIDCGKRKPLTEDFWHKDSNGRHGFKTSCKVCRNKARRDAYHRAA